MGHLYRWLHKGEMPELVSRSRDRLWLRSLY